LADGQAAAVGGLSGRTLYGYGLGSVAQGVAGQALSTSIISQFLFLVVGMPALLVGAAILISQIVDAVADPILGLWSDRTRSTRSLSLSSSSTASTTPPTKPTSPAWLRLPARPA
jgi:Na+/melibiose symporter-like transporter